MCGERVDDDGFPWSGGCGDVGKRAGRALGASSVVATSEGIGEGAEGASARRCGGGVGTRDWERLGKRRGEAEGCGEVGERAGNILFSLKRNQERTFARRAFHQKFHTHIPQDLTRGPRPNLGPTPELDPHLDPIISAQSRPSTHPQRATGPLPHLPAPLPSPPAAQSRVPTPPSRRSALRPLRRPPRPPRPPRSPRPNSLLTHGRHACQHPRIHPTTGGHPIRSSSTRSQTYFTPAPGSTRSAPKDLLW